MAQREPLARIEDSAETDGQESATSGHSGKAYRKCRLAEYCAAMLVPKALNYAIAKRVPNPVHLGIDS